MDTSVLPRKLWEHPNPESTPMYKFIQYVNSKHGLNLKGFWALYDWSVAQYAAFWEDVWQFLPLISEGEYKQVIDPKARMDASPAWFAGIRLNFAQNVLFCPEPTNKEIASTLFKPDERIACSEIREGGSAITHLTWGALRHRVGLLLNAMASRGLKRGDRVAVVAANSIDTLVVFLATTALGGLFSSSSTDMGIKGILDRTTQIKPRWIFVDDAALYNGKTVDLRSKITQISQGMKGVDEFDRVVSIPRFQQASDVAAVPRTMTLQEFLSAGKGKADLRFERVGFNDPFLIVYSSGTTGQPKCIVHGTGGVLINAMKESVLHRDLHPDTTVLQYTTTGWIMYLVCVLNLLPGARAVLYDGSPFQPNRQKFIELISSENVTDLGISPRYLHELQTNNVIPREVADLSKLRRITSTGMVLVENLFEWIYDVAFPPHVQLANISGGTDLAGCFALENPLTPLYVGGCQGPSLGNKVEVYDQLIEGGKGVKGQPVPHGVPGELVATVPFPNQPVQFWGDETGEKYFGAYYAKYDNVWTHGDFVVIHPLHRGITFLGRADGVLNPSGVRFGSAEIYNVIETKFADEVADSICVGQRRPQDPDESVMLFLLMRPGKRFTQDLARRIRATISKELSKRHAPRYVFETPEIPTTVNLKKVELPVKRIVSGQKVKPSGTLLNPQSLDYYYQFAKVEEQLARYSSKL